MKKSFKIFNNNLVYFGRKMNQTAAGVWPKKDLWAKKSIFLATEESLKLPKRISKLSLHPVFPLRKICLIGFPPLWRERKKSDDSCVRNCSSGGALDFRLCLILENIRLRQNRSEAYLEKIFLKITRFFLGESMFCSFRSLWKGQGSNTGISKYLVP